MPLSNLCGAGSWRGLVTRSPLAHTHYWDLGDSGEIGDATGAGTVEGTTSPSANGWAGTRRLRWRRLVWTVHR